MNERAREMDTTFKKLGFKKKNTEERAREKDRFKDLKPKKKKNMQQNREKGDSVYMCVFLDMCV